MYISKCLLSLKKYTYHCLLKFLAEVKIIGQFVDVDHMLKKNKDQSENGLSILTIDNIPTIKFKKSECVDSKEQDKTECSICLVPFEEGEELRLLFCFHRYHKKCIDSWLLKKSQCPNCNFNIRSIN